MIQLLRVLALILDNVYQVLVVFDQIHLQLS